MSIGRICHAAMAFVLFSSFTFHVWIVARGIYAAQRFGIDTAGTCVAAAGIALVSGVAAGLVSLDADGQR